MPERAYRHNMTPRRRASAARHGRPAKRGLTERPRLLRLLDGTRGARAGWIQAPAGSRKTALVATWLASRRIPCLWLGLGADDADASAFLRRLVHAAAPVTRRRQAGVPHAMHGRPLPFEPSARRFFDQLFALLPEPFVMVLDDYQAVPGDSPLHCVVATALEALPAASRIVFLSRADVPPALARWRADRQFMELPAEALRLTRGEALELGRGLSRGLPRDVASINALARGWIAGLVLLLKDPSVKREDGIPKSLRDYFETQIYRGVQPHVRELLAATAWLPSVTPAGAAAAAGRSDSRELLADLCRRRLFVEPCEGAGEAYRYHPLFRRFLRDRSAGCSPVRILTLGAFRVELDGRALAFDGKARAKPLELLQALIAHGCRGVAVDRLVEPLWPEAEGDAGQRSFDITLHRLRKLLRREDALILSERKLSIDSRVAWVDARAMEALVATIDAANGTLDVAGARDCAGRLLTLYGGEFLAQERLRDWMLPRRERLRCAFQRAVLAVGGRLEADGLWQAAADLYRGAVERDPQAEALYQRLMRCLGRLGLASDVARAYFALRHELARALGVAPSPRSDEIFREFCAGRRPVAPCASEVTERATARDPCRTVEPPATRE